MSRPVVCAQTEFRAIGTTNRILATDLAVLPEATAIARDYLDALDRAVSRFRTDSEVCRLAVSAAAGPASALMSPTFAQALRAGLYAAALTDGLVDPTVGSAVIASGYDADLDLVQARAGFEVSDAGPVPGWRSVRIDDADRLTVPAGCVIDLGATAKAFAADTIAAMLADQLPGGFLVNLGGDLAVSGRIPDGGWRVGVQTADGGTAQVVTTTGQAMATSSTRLRTWRVRHPGLVPNLAGRGQDDNPAGHGPDPKRAAGALDDDASSRRTGATAHHIVDPRTGRTSSAVWAQVTCAGVTALEANAASTAAIVLGLDAPTWLEQRGIPARLDAGDGQVRLTAGWPAPDCEVPRPLISL